MDAAFPQQENDSMPQVNCPQCDRCIALEDAELILLIECAGCDARFYPMMPLDGPLPSHPTRAKKPIMQASTAIQASAAVAEPDAPNLDPPAKPKPKKPRKKKRRHNRTALFVGLGVGLVCLLGLTVGIVLLVQNELSRPNRAAKPGAGNDGKTNMSAFPPPLSAPPGAMPVTGPGGIVALPGGIPAGPGSASIGPPTVAVPPTGPVGIVSPPGGNPKGPGNAPTVPFGPPTGPAGRYPPPPRA